MRSYFRKLIYLVLTACIFPAQAGSFEDWFLAIRQDKAAEITSLLQRGFDPNTIGPDGLHGLFLAVREGALKSAMVLAEWPKTQVEWRSDKDESPLMLAALKGQEDVVRKLIDRGADVNKPGWTPLHYASTNGHVGIMNLLLEHHAYLDAESPNKTTPLMMAAFYGSSQAVKLLLEAGADPTLRNEQGLSAVDFAQRGNRPDAAAMIAESIRNRKPKGQW